MNPRRDSPLWLYPWPKLEITVLVDLHEKAASTLAVGLMDTVCATAHQNTFAYG
jgi:hypothetical protein